VGIASHSDRAEERRRHVAVPLLVAAGGLAAAAVLDHPAAMVAALSVASMGNFGCLGPFWAMATRSLGSRAAAGGIAMINSIGNLGGFLGPSVVGLMKTHVSDGFAGGFLVLAASLVAAGVLTLRLGSPDRTQPDDLSAPGELEPI